MNAYIVIIFLYLIGLTVMNFWLSRKVKTRDDMMVASRQIPWGKMVFTLICTWIGSGTFIAGAEFAAKAGWSALWQPAGAWIGIIVIYFLASKIRTFGQYTVGDILEVRYGSIARIVGAIAILISFTVIVSYQFKAGGYILNAISDGAISNEQGMFMAFLFVTIFTAIGGMIAVANTDLPNGIIILSSMILSTPLVILASGGWDKIRAILPDSHFQVISPEFGGNPYLKIPAIGLSGMLLLLGVQSLYQKFYSARNPKEARKAAGFWVVGTIIIETVAIVIAVFASSYFWKELQSGGIDHAAVIIQAAKRMIPLPVGVLLLGAATVVVISTGMNYLLSPTTTLIHDIYLRFIRKKSDKENVSEKGMVILQRVLIIMLGCFAFLMAWKMRSVLESAYFAYTVYGVAITPALIAALAWKKVTKIAGMVSIISGTVITVSLKLAGYIWPQIMVPMGDPNGDPFGIPIIYPALAVSLITLVVISRFTKPPSKEVLSRFFSG
ncbi:sodium:solute symporter family protein [Candidatus Aminicenantes bacterium AC-708-I09]|nr:sodium:solute symporter family protein [Candidatus Aminicenantes bacterium AC-708-I09]